MDKRGDSTCTLQRLRLTGEVQWNLTEIEVPSVEHCTREYATEVQDIRELGMGWAWLVNDLRAFLPAWQEKELASPCPEEPVSQIDADVLLECIGPYSGASLTSRPGSGHPLL